MFLSSGPWQKRRGGEEKLAVKQCHAKRYGVVSYALTSDPLKKTELFTCKTVVVATTVQLNTHNVSVRTHL